MRIKKFIVVAFVLVAGILLSGTVMALQPITINVNGTTVKTDVPAQVVNGRTMVPVRFVSEALGAKVEWDEKNQSVNITMDKANSSELLKFNGEQTTWPYWYENGVLYMECRNTMELLREVHPHPSYVVSYFNNIKSIQVGNKTVEVNSIEKDGYTLIPLNTLKKEGELNYEWNAESADLSIIK